MIDKAKIDYFLNEILEGTDLFLVDLTVKPSNKIIIEIDSLQGVTIDECAHVSSTLETKLNRNVEDFDLEVSSPGLGLPFKVKQQYQKNVGNQVSVLMKSGDKYTGKLLEAHNSGLKVEIKEKMKVEGKKKPEVVVVEKELLFNDIKITKAIINF
ncbi:MAG TPA: ribosome assembly cofactor RimP [Bacteroidales bacterium]|nr:ribosome assembly cofactor RimP [Bacteroidales bacterium]